MKWLSLGLGPGPSAAHFAGWLSLPSTCPSFFLPPAPTAGSSPLLGLILKGSSSERSCLLCLQTPDPLSCSYPFSSLLPASPSRPWEPRGQDMPTASISPTPCTPSVQYIVSEWTEGREGPTVSPCGCTKRHTGHSLLVVFDSPILVIPQINRTRTEKMWTVDILGRGKKE